jgi:signal transduction histidine kinase
MDILRETASSRPPVSRKELAVVALLVSGIVLSRLHSYLLFHTLVELSCTAVGLTAFALAWNTRQHLEDGFLRVVGLAIGPSAAIALLHTLSYRGMGVFPDHASDLPTQLWVALRIVQGSTLFAATVPVLSNQPARRIVMASSAVGGLLVALIFLGLFPTSFIEGQGLTPFKVGAEYAVMLVLAAAAVRLWRDRSPRHPMIRTIALGMLASSGLESMAFTLYVDIYGAMNMIGHALALLHALLIYIAVAWVGLTLPQETLYARQLALKNRFQEDAERANEDILRFAEVLAHHLQEPVRQQHVYSQLLARALPDQLSGDARAALDAIQAGALRQRALLRDALRYLSLERSSAQGAWCNGGAALRAALQRMEALVRQTGAVILHRDLPAARIDQDSLSEVFAILIGNALQHRRQDISPVVAVTCAEQGDGLLFSVADNGPGIPEEYRDRIFRVFERLAGPSQSPESTGIGLALARKIIEIADGRIWAENNSQGGTSIHFLLKKA